MFAFPLHFVFSKWESFRFGKKHVWEEVHGMSNRSKEMEQGRSRAKRGRVIEGGRSSVFDSWFER